MIVVLSNYLIYLILDAESAAANDNDVGDDGDGGSDGDGDADDDGGGDDDDDDGGAIPAGPTPLASVSSG